MGQTGLTKRPSQILQLMYLTDVVLRADAANDGADDSEYATAVGQAVGRLRAHLEATGQWTTDGGWYAREKLAWTLRHKDRLKWHEVAERLDVCPERARQLAAFHEGMLKQEARRGGEKWTKTD